MSLTKEQILGLKDYEIREVDVPAWGGSVHVRTLGGLERAKAISAYNKQLEKLDNEDDNTKGHLFMCFMIAASLCDSDGELVFSPNDVEKIGQKKIEALEAVFEVADELNVLSLEREKELAKN